MEPVLLWNETDCALFAGLTGIGNNNPWVQISAGTLQGLTGVQGLTGIQGTGGVNSGSSSINGMAYFPDTTTVTQALTGSTPAMTWTGLNFVVAADATFVSPRISTPLIQSPTALSVTGPNSAQFYCGDINHIAYGAGIFADTSSVAMRSGVIFSPTYSLVLDHDRGRLTTNAAVDLGIGPGLLQADSSKIIGITNIYDMTATAGVSPMGLDSSMYLRFQIDGTTSPTGYWVIPIQY
jgi:hypothetical protein